MFYRVLFKFIVGCIGGSVILNPLLAFAQPATPTQFRDTAGDLYAKEIEQATSQGIIAGFEDGTFRPQAALTREQLVSIVVNAMPKVPLAPYQGTAPTLPSILIQVTANPFPDVDQARWSAPKIQYLKSLGILRGYPDGTFRPTQTVTRAELMVMLQAIDRYLVEFRGNWDGRQNFGFPDPLAFSDIQNHWARDTIRAMSSNCHEGRVATFLNEMGTRFAPNEPARRNYAAAATVREIRCLSIPSIPS
jgi:hypothetical protein